MQQDSARRLLELMRDVLRLYANFEREMGAAEFDHGFNMAGLSSVLSKASSPEFLQSLVAMGTQAQTAYLTLVAQLGQMTNELQNPLALTPPEKIAFADRLDNLVKQLEGAVGVGKVVNKPTDIDPALLERCANKDYQDAIRNAFPLLEDRIRSRLGINREEYFGDKLIDYAFNPKTGKLELGGSEAERQGVYFLYKGAFLFLRNPPSHTQTLDEDRNAALKLMHTSDFLIKMIDKASLRP